jgi:transcription elongation factor Elf1
METEGAYMCPHCGEEIVVPIDASAGASQLYVEDCPVCCSPTEIRVEFDDLGARLEASAES